MHDDQNFSISHIAKRLNRNVQTIWTTYNHSKNKNIICEESKIKIPLNIFSKDKNSILESLVFYLKSTHELKFSDIGKLLNRDTRTIYIYFDRYNKKIKKEEKLK